MNFFLCCILIREVQMVGYMSSLVTQTLVIGYILLKSCTGIYASGQIYDMSGQNHVCPEILSGHFDKVNSSTGPVRASSLLL